MFLSIHTSTGGRQVLCWLLISPLAMIERLPVGGNGQSRRIMKLKDVGWLHFSWIPRYAPLRTTLIFPHPKTSTHGRVPYGDGWM